MNTTQYELKNCPFCGNSAELCDGDIVQCSNSLCQVSQWCPDAWNARASALPESRPAGVDDVKLPYEPVTGSDPRNPSIGVAGSPNSELLEEIAEAINKEGFCVNTYRAAKAALAAMSTKGVEAASLPDFTTRLIEAKAQVQSYPLFNKFIKGTPLENDIAVWIAEASIKSIWGAANHINGALCDEVAALQKALRPAGPDLGEK